MRNLPQEEVQIGSENSTTLVLIGLLMLLALGATATL